jgi:hypothetical protein
VIDTIGAAVSTVKLDVVAVDELPAPSWTRTVIVCAPSATVVVNGDEQLANVPASTRHCTIVGEPADVNATVGVLSFESVAGCAVMVTVGATVSIVNVFVVAWPALPAPSVATTVIVWLPSASAEEVNGDEHVASEPVSTRHWVVVVSADTVNTTVGVVSFDSAAGCVVNVTTGAVVSTVKLLVVADELLPAASVTRTVIVCAPSVTVAAVNGVVQLASAPLSTWHWVSVGEPPTVKPTVGVASFDRAAGCEVIVTVGATVSTVKLPVVADDEFPAPSVATMVIVCAPSATDEAVNGLVQLTSVPVSTRHCVVVGLPVIVNATVGVLSFDTAAGSVLIVMAGGVVSTVKLFVVTEAELPTASVTRTVIVWAPSATAAAVNGDAHVANVPASTWHWISVGAPPVVKVTVGVVSFDRADGCVLRVTVGGVVSTRNGAVVADPALPAASVATTVIVCVPSATVEAVNGEVHAASAPASTRHWIVCGAPAVVKVAVGVASFDEADGSAVNVTVGGAVSIANVPVEACEELPAPSVTRTVSVWLPSASAPDVNGELHAAKVPASTWHWITVGEPAVVNAIVGVVSFDSAAGSTVIVTVGATVSIVNVLVVAVDAFPAASVTRTEIVWPPSARAPDVNGDVHVANAPASTAHSIVTGDPAVLNAAVGVVSLDSADGCAMNVAVGATVSTVNIELAVAWLPTPSVPRTVNVWAPSLSEAVVCGELHAANAPASTRQSIAVAPAAVNVNAGVGSFVNAPGPVMIVTVGGVVSTLNDTIALPVLPAASVARTVT